MNKKGLTVLIHVAGWLTLLLLPVILMNYPADNPMANDPQRPKWFVTFLPFLIITYGVLILFFYANLYYLLPRLYYQRKKWLYFLIAMIVMLLVVYCVPYIKHHYFQTNFSSRMPEGRWPARDSMFRFEHHPPGPNFFMRPKSFWGMSKMDRMLGFFNFLVIWLLSTAAFLTMRFRNMEQRNKEMKVEKLDAELSYLKAQINPHLLFNTLNNIYSLSICESEQTPEAILKLSAIMRYVTQEAAAEMVPVAKEIEYLSNYIDLQQLRSNHHLAVRFNVVADTETQMIAPLLLISFIENAFKYGVSNHVACFVNIDITIANNKLKMTAANKKLVTPEKDKTATGIANTRRRLQLQYPNKHELIIEETKELYEVNLTINLV